MHLCYFSWESQILGEAKKGEPAKLFLDSLVKEGKSSSKLLPIPAKIGHLLSTHQCSACAEHFNWGFTIIPRDKYFGPLFSDKETEAWQDKVTCLSKIIPLINDRGMIVTTFLPDSWLLLSITIVSSSLWNIYSYCWWKDEYTDMYCFYNQKKIKVTFGTNETQHSNSRTFYLTRIKNYSTINWKSPVTLIKPTSYLILS